MAAAVERINIFEVWFLPSTLEPKLEKAFETDDDDNDVTAHDVHDGDDEDDSGFKIFLFVRK